MKILILGLSGAGKSSVAEKLAKKYNTPLIEADDEVMKANGGTWPKIDEKIDTFLDEIFERTNKVVIEMDKVIYVTSWMLVERVKDFYDKGFKIVEMHADFDELLKRKDSRDGQSEIRTQRFKNTYISYTATILSEECKQYYVLSLDTTKLSTEEIVSKIEAKIHP